MLQLCRVWTVV